MNTFLKNGTLMGALAALMLGTTGCAEFYKKTYDWSDAKGTEFTKALAEEYYNFGQSEENVMFDDLDAAYFMKKAVKVQDGCAVMPEHLDGWNLPNHTVPELQAARDRLIHAMQHGAQTIAPQMTAKAQVNFDCWVEQQEENWQKDDIKACRDTFYTSMDAVEHMVFGMLQAPPAHVVQFATGSADIDAHNMMIIKEAVIFAASTEHGRRVHLIGRTDAAGSDASNKLLALKRAKAVKEAMLLHGVPEGMITLEAAGERPGGKQRDEDQRRVDILFLEYK